MPRDVVGVEGIPDDLVLPPAEALGAAQALLDEGRPFAAHEVLEGAWKTAPEEHRALWQGLAQVAVGLTHLQRGNRVGAARLLRRGAARVLPYAGQAPHDIDASGVAAFAERAAGGLEAEDTGTGPALPELRLRR